MYADDLALLSPCLNAFQLMVNKRKSSCEAIGLTLNVNQSSLVYCIGCSSTLGRNFVSGLL